MAVNGHAAPNGVAAGSAEKGCAHAPLIATKGTALSLALDHSASYIKHVKLGRMQSSNLGATIATPIGLMDELWATTNLPGIVETTL